MSGSVSLDAGQEGETFDAPQENLWDVPLVDASVTLDPQAKQKAEVSLALAAGRAEAQGKMTLLHHGDPATMNSVVQRRSVAPQTRTITLHLDKLRLGASPSQNAEAQPADGLRLYT